LSVLANLVGMSSSTFSRFFGRTFGCTPHRYVLAQRMDWAKALVISGKAIAEVAHAVAFTPSHFSSAFQKMFGMSPRKLRSEHQSCVRYITTDSSRRTRDAATALARPVDSSNPA
jgi:AraC-like DNA-binding protein